MPRVLLIHWNESELPPRIARLRKAGHRVVAHFDTRSDGLRDTIRNPPDAVVIDLSRLPSHGRAVAYVYRQSKSTRNIPIVFVEGAPEKVARVRADLPDAVYATWDQIAAAVKKALSERPAKYVIPRSTSGYSGTPLPKKLGVDKADTLVLLDAPRGFETQIAAGNHRCEVRRGARGQADLVVWFVKSAAKLRGGLQRVQGVLADGGALWIAWPKKASGVATDLSESVVRKTALAAGLVDYKVCAIDATWSGLKFARKKRVTDR